MLSISVLNTADRNCGNYALIDQGIAVVCSSNCRNYPDYTTHHTSSTAKKAKKYFDPASIIAPAERWLALLASLAH